MNFHDYYHNINLKIVEHSLARDIQLLNFLNCGISTNSENKKVEFLLKF
jgi:hypothetical protein